MQALKKLFDKYFEYLLFGIMLIMFVLSCFIKPLPYIALGFAFVSAFALKTDKLVKFHIFLMLFPKPLMIGGAYYRVYDLLFVLPYLKNFVCDIVFKHKKISFKPLIVIALCLIYYLVIPTHYGSSIYNIVYRLAFLINIYFVYESRDSLDFKSIIKVLCYSFIVSSLFSFLNQYTPKLKLDGAYYYQEGMFRFDGMFLHPNEFADFAMIALVGLMVLMYFEKISMPEFLGLFLTIFVFGYISLSRTFIVVFVVMLLLFIAVYFAKYKTDALRFLCGFIALIILFYLIMDKYTYLLAYRFENSIEGDGLIYTLEMLFLPENRAMLQGVYDGIIYYDTGRLSLWTLYFRRIFETSSSFLFGYGLNAPDIGKVHSHNIAIFVIYKYGLIGTILSVLFILSMVEFKKVKELKTYIGSLLVPISFIGVSLLNNNNFDSVIYFIIIAAICFSFKIKKDKSSAEKERIKMIERLDIWKTKYFDFFDK